MPATHLAIVTGTSRGLGAALARQLLAQGAVVLGLARHANPDLAPAAGAPADAWQQWDVDLTDAASAAARLAAWLRTVAPGHFAKATLINNAGVLPFVAPLRDAEAAAIARGLRVNLEAPMLLTAAFLRATRDWPGERRVLNISSGLGRRPMASQSGYCASKAGMDLFTRCVALEEARKANGARLCALAPGVIDTDMQVTLRGADAGQFPDRGRFEELKRNGHLVSAADTAARILAYVDSAAFGGEPVADIRTLS